jgi:ribulose 1,5-bisphosphate carboxylase large subunit-like protein/predicted transcriptional regulator
MQLANQFPHLIPDKLKELAEKMVTKRVPEVNEKGFNKIYVEFLTEDVERLIIKFFASILKILSNEHNWKILRNIREHSRLSSTEIHNLRENLSRLYKHGLITSGERKNTTLTQLGERILSSHINLSPYLREAKSIERNIILLQLLLSGTAKSFSELEEETGLHVASLSRSLKNLIMLGFVSISEDGKYQIKDEASLLSLKKLCEEIIKKYREMGLYFQDGEIRARTLFEEPETLPATLKYFILEDVIGDHIIVTYSYKSEKKKEDLIKKIIHEQTRWKGDTCKPVYYDQVGRLRIAYKVDDIASLQQFFNLFCLHAIKDFDRLVVEDVEIPKSFLERCDYLKPRYGIDGIRGLLGIRERRPLLHVIIPQYLKKGDKTADFVRCLAEAGVDAVGDHQFMGFKKAEFEERIESVAEIIDKSSHKLLFYPYVEGEDFLEKIDIVKAQNSKYLGLGLSPLSFGLPTTIFIRKNYSFPLHLHLTLHAIFTRLEQSYYSFEKGFEAGHGISSRVILKLFALCGGDEVNVDYFGLYSIDAKDVAIQCEILRRFNVFPALVGGINLTNLSKIIRDYTGDIILKISGRKFLEFPSTVEEMKEYVRAYKRLIEKTIKNEREDEEIMKWLEREERMKIGE